MGFFSMFKKNAPTYNEKVNWAYSCYKPESVGLVFPAGKNQASKIISSLSKIYDIDLESCDARRYFDLLKIYSDAYLRVVVVRATQDLTITSLMVNHGDLIVNEEVANKTLAYISFNIANPDFAIKSEDDMEMIEQMAATYTEMKQMKIANTEKVVNKYLNDPQYGLVSNKPIYVDGVKAAEQYLESLRTSRGEKLIWKRDTSIKVSNINGRVDIYESTLPSGQPYKRLYINIYSFLNSSKIPKGFSGN